MAYIDITPTVSARIGVFPGDTPFSEKTLMDFSQGNHLKLSSITTTVHLGAHADAPNHYQDGGIGIAEVPVETYIGPCQVIHVDIDRGQRVQIADLNGIKIEAPRVLIGTGSFPDPDNWNSDFAALSAELIEHLQDQGVKLVGIDTPSIDLEDSKELPAHKVVARAGMAILEGLVLEKVNAGLYELIALPLKLEGLDASPVRAVLRI